MRALAAVVCVCLLGVGCAGEPEATSLEPSTAPVVTPAASGPQEIAGEGAPLDPGTYTYSPFEPAVTFDLGDGWEGGHTLPEFFDVWRGMRIAVMFARPSFLIDAGARVPARRVTPGEALELLRARGTESRRAPSIVLDGGAVPSVYLSTDEPVALFGGPDGEFSTDPSHRLRIAALEVDGTLVLVMVSARTPIELDDRLAVTEMLGTIDFEG